MKLKKYYFELISFYIFLSFLLYFFKNVQYAPFDTAWYASLVKNFPNCLMISGTISSNLFYDECANHSIHPRHYLHQPLSFLIFSFLNLFLIFRHMTLCKFNLFYFQFYHMQFQ